MDQRLDFIFRRRSIRKFVDRPVAKDDITALLEAAMAAPSSGNRKPWHFVVVTKRDLLVQLADSHPNGKMLAQAPLAILAAADTQISPHGWVQDCSAALENILLAGPAIDLGGVWLGVWPKEDRMKAISEILKLPTDLTPMGIVALGYPAENPAPRTQYDPDCTIWKE